MIEIICENCGKKFYRCKSEAAKAEHHFCSNKCRFEYQGRDRVLVTCPVCFREFYVSKARYSTSSRICCSKECGEKYNSHGNKVCEYCGKIFYTRSKDQRFCSKECRGKHDTEEHGYSPSLNLNKTCDCCGKQFLVTPSRASNRTHFFCCKACEAQYRKENNPNYLPCEICGKLTYVKPSDQKNRKQGITCSFKCMGVLRSKIYIGEDNPNYGNTGMKNPMSIDRRISNYGYVLIKSLDHPFKRDGGWVLEHRLVAEQHLLTDENSVAIDGKRYLSPEYDVHHIDHNRKNNSVQNLLVLTRSEHMKLHGREKKLITYNDTDTISFARIHPDAKIPSKREEDGLYDVYAAFDDDFITIDPHKVKLIPTGIISAFNPKWRICARERGSASKTNLGVKCGQIDSGYRGEWFIAIRNDNDVPVEISKFATDNQFNKDVLITPYSKAICQVAIEEVPKVQIVEENPDTIKNYTSERKEGCLGSSNK